MNVMVRAWEIAREGQNKFGGKVKEYFAQALKMAWAEKKNQGKEVVALKTWFINKNFSHHEAYALKVSDFQIIKETAKAYRLKAVSDYGNLYIWAPKSVCLNSEQYEAEMIKAEKAFEKGLEYNRSLLAQAKALGIKGVRKGMRTKTLERKIAEFKMAN